MSDRISYAQAVLAAIYASPLMAVVVMTASGGSPPGGKLRGLIGPWLICAFLLLLPTAVSNLAARGLLGWVGSGLLPAPFHTAVGLLAGALLLWIVNLVARGTREIGGGPPGRPMQLALMIAAACNAGMIYAVWHFGWITSLE